MSALNTHCRFAGFKGFCLMWVISFAPLAGCAGSLELADSSPAVRPVPVYLDTMPRLLPRERLDQYACFDRRPLMCVCRSRIAADCECRCPL
jgi:hypothetical protein